MANFTCGLVDVLTYNAGTYASPVHVVVDGFEDFDASDERNAITLKIRRYETELNLLGQRKIDNGFSLACEPDNAVWQFLYAAYLNKTPVEFFAFYKFIPLNDPDDGQPGSGSKARRATMLISQFAPPQKLEGIDVNELKLIPSLNPVDPADDIHEPEDYVVP